MADPVELQMSVTAIKRVDPYVKDILAKSTHVALYKFNSFVAEWEKTNTEGALFLYSRNGEPLHNIMIMNRLNTNNLIEPIANEFEYQMQAPFLLFRNSNNKIFGIWFYNREECVHITLLLESVIDSDKEKSIDMASKTEDVDIFRLLTRAQEDFNKTPDRCEQQPFTASTPRAPDVTSQSVMEFFAKAGSQSVTKPVLHTSEAEIQYTFQRLMSNPAHSVEHIEKQQRSTTPQDQVIGRKKSNSSGGRLSATLPPGGDQLHENGTAFTLPPPQPTISTSPIIALLQQQSKQRPKEEREGASPLAQILFETPQKPALLMPPIMFASSSKEKIGNEHNIDNKLSTVEPLTRNQLVQAMMYLLKTDSEFVTKLHEAYVKSLSEMVNHNNLI